MYKIIFLFLLSVSLFSSEIKSLAKGYIIVAVKYDHNPMSYLNQSLRVKGIEVDLINKIADILNVRVKFVELRDKKARYLLVNNKIDIVLDSSITNLYDSDEIIFSQSYFEDKQVLLTFFDSKLDMTKEFIDIKIGALKDSIFTNDFMKIKPKSNFVLFSENFQLTKALAFKNVEAILLDYEIAKKFVEDSNNKFKFIHINEIKRPYKMAYKSENIDLKNKIDEILKDIL